MPLRPSTRGSQHPNPLSPGSAPPASPPRCRRRVAPARAPSASPIRASVGAARQSIISAPARASTSPAGTSQPSAPCSHQLGNAGDVGRDHRPPQRHRLHDHDRQPFGEARQHQGASAARISCAPASPSTQPVIATRSPRPCCAMSASIVGAHLAVAGEHQSQRRASATSRATASISSSCPFCSQRRPTHDATVPPAGIGRAPRWKPARRRSARRGSSASRRVADQRMQLAAPNELIATTKPRAAPSRRGSSATGASNSSGPCTVKLYGGPPSCAPASRPRPGWCRSAHVQVLAVSRSSGHAPGRLRPGRRGDGTGRDPSGALIEAAGRAPARSGPARATTSRAPRQPSGERDRPAARSGALALPARRRIDNSARQPRTAKPQHLDALPLERAGSRAG